MYEQVKGDILYLMFYAAVTAMALMACCYLLFRRGNAFAHDITPPVRLRRWTAAYFAVMVMSHLWYLPIAFLHSVEAVRRIYLIGGLLDCVTVYPLAIGVLFAMLQDRRRPLWPACVMIAPLAVVLALCVAGNSDIPPMLYVYFLVQCAVLIAYMVLAVRQYGRWLRDNYADLEHKEVWHSFVVLAFTMVLFVFYAFCGDSLTSQYAMQVNNMALIGYLLWRVETLSDLGSQPDAAGAGDGDSRSPDLPAGAAVEQLPDKQSAGSSPLDAANPALDTITRQLQRHCIDSRLYLQHDLNVQQLARVVGINRLYLSQYFSRQGITYNIYINDLRIRHFMNLYREAIAAERTFTAQQLAAESGYRSYSTFALAFKQRMGVTVSSWMRDTSNK